MNASTRSLKALVFSESSKTTTSPLTTAGEPILAQHHGRRNPGESLGAVDLVVVMGWKAPRKSLSLTTKKVVGGDVYVIQDVTQVLVVATVQVGLNSIGYSGGEVFCFGLAHTFLEDVGLHATAVPVLLFLADRISGGARLSRWVVGGPCILPCRACLR